MSTEESQPAKSRNPENFTFLDKNPYHATQLTRVKYYLENIPV